MANIYFTDFFELDPDALDQHGAFNVSLIGDLPVFVDPFLLFNSKNQAYQQLHESLIQYMRFLKQVTLAGRLNDGLIDAWFTFREVKQNWLGFSANGNRGHGLGPGFAKALHKNFLSTFRDFGEEQLTKTSHIEKLCLIRTGVGRDNVSDFTTNLVKRHLALYTQEFAQRALAPSQRRRFQVSKSWFNYETTSWVTEEFELPAFENDFVLLTPKDMLTRDHAWINRGELINRLEEIAEALPDGTLRAQLNRYLVRRLSAVKKQTEKRRREIIGEAIDNYPQVLDHYIRIKEEEGEQAADISAERIDEASRLFVRQLQHFVSKSLTPLGFYQLASTTLDEARERLLFLKDVIENKGGHRIFYIDGKPVERESDLQILYRLTWYASPSVVSREVNDGRGPVDFQIARSPVDKTLVELKLAKNSQLRKNLENQCTVYERASNATHPSIKGIIFFTENEEQRLLGILEDLGLRNDPHIIVIDACADNKPSGSKA